MPYFTSLSSRRRFLKHSVTAGAAAAVVPALRGGRVISWEARPSVPLAEPFELDEITIAELQDGMKSGRFSARSLVEKYSARIEAIDKQGPAINSVIEMNPDALAIADAIDQERKAKGPVSYTHLTLPTTPYV